MREQAQKLMGLVATQGYISNSQWPRQAPPGIEARSFDATLRMYRPRLTPYSTWLAETFVRCQERLRALDYLVEHYVERFDEKHVRLMEYACLPSEGGERDVLFQLGHKYVGRSSAGTVVELSNGYGERPLEPAFVLAAVTLLAERWHDGRQGSPMRIECPGAMYSPKGNRKFDDVLRVDFHPPCHDDTHGFVGLDWNWNTRARALHGVATGILL